MSVKFDNNYGFLTYEFDPPPAGETDAVVRPPVRLDVYETHKAYSDVLESHKDSPDPHAAGLAWREYLYGLGFPPMSVAHGYHVVRQCIAEMDRLGKADAGSESAA